MNWWENLNNVIAATSAALLGVIGFLVRKILTNDRRIAMLEAEVKGREAYRKERDDFLNDQIHEIRTDIKRLIGKMTADYRDEK